MVAPSGQKATGDGYGFLPGTLEPWAERLEKLRPWTDQVAVTDLLAEWAGDYAGDGTVEGAESVAEQLSIVGQARNLAELSPLGAAAIAFHLLGNVAAGRNVLDYGLPVEIIGPPRTMRRWRNEYGWERAMQLLQQDLDVAAETRKAPNTKAARKRLQRRRTPG